MKPKSCPYCGNNPVPHFIYWNNESLNILLTPFRQRLLYNPITRFLKSRGLGEKSARSFLFLAEGLKIITRQDDILKCKVRRAQVLWEEAERRGIKMQELLLFGHRFDTYVAQKEEPRTKNQEPNKSQIINHKSEIIFSGLPRPRGYMNNRLDLMDDKAIFKKMMLANGLPSPAGAAATSFRQALKIFNNIQKPVIVKPRAGSRGRHSTTYVSSAAELKSAFKIAKQLCYWIIVEEQLFGPVYRATLVNFGLCGILRGDPPQITGDGQKNISELIKEKNQAPRPGVKDIVIGPSMELFLSRQGLSLSSIPKKGENVNLSEKIGVNYGGSSGEDLDVCHQDNKELFLKAAKVLGDPIVGFDFIIPDIAKSWKQQKCGFIEVNSLPFINLHHDPLLGKPRNVAAKVWDMVGW